MGGQPSFTNNDRFRIERLEAAVGELYRKRDRRLPNVRDLNDVDGWGAADGHVVLYDTTTGKYKPALAPPFLKFNLNGTLSVSSSDHDPVGSSGKLILVRALLATSGSTTTTAVLKKNASTTVATFSFTSGNTTPTSNPTVSVSFVDGDYFWVDLTAAGTGAAGLVIAGWATAA